MGRSTATRSDRPASTTASQARSSASASTGSFSTNWSRGNFLPRTQAYLTEVIRGLKDEGCDAVALACTEIPLLMTQESSPLPGLDSPRLVARAALRKALEG